MSLHTAEQQPRLEALPERPDEPAPPEAYVLAALCLVRVVPADAGFGF
jgi:hypothetical protein